LSGKSNNLGQFWQELKRRKVIHVITVYATSTFVLIELVNNLSEPLNLPARLPTIVIVVLAIGFPLAVILSWLYDLTSDGVEKTKPLSEIQEGGKTVIPNAWKIATYVSFAVIIGLLVLNVLGNANRIRPGSIQSFVILPFENFTGDEQLEYFVSGMHASLIQDMGKISGFNVVNKTTSNVYKSVDMTLQEIASELNRDAVIEADVMCLGDTICLQVRVISAFPEEKTIWIADYKEEKSQMLTLYNRITKQIADEVRIELTADEQKLMAELRTVDPKALDAYMRGLFYLDKIDRDGLRKAAEQFIAAIEIEPDWAAPYAGLAEVGAYQMQMSFIQPSMAIPKIYENLIKALELDPNSANSHYIKAVIAVSTEWDWKKGEEEYIKSLELNQSNALCRMFYAHLLMILHRSDEALYQADRALELDPLRPFILGLYAVVMIEAGNTQSAILHAKKALSIDPNHRFAVIHLTNAYRANGDYEKWFEGWRKRTRHDEEIIATIYKAFQDKGYLAAVEMIIKTNEEEANEKQINALGHARKYLEIKNDDKAMDWFEKAYEIHHPGMQYISTRLYDRERLKENPRYIELLKKMNLPLPED
jgi:adenylate cyclase